jgi:hypothetical protein
MLPSQKHQSIIILFYILFSHCNTSIESNSFPTKPTMPSHPQHSVRNNQFMIESNAVLLTEPDSDGSDSSFSIERVLSTSCSYERRKHQQRTARISIKSRSQRVRSVSFDTKPHQVHHFDQSVVDHTEVWYNSSDYRKFCRDNQNTLSQAKRKTPPSQWSSLSPQHEASSLRGLEKHDDASITIAVECVLRNQHNQNASVLAARYSKFSKHSLMAAIQRAREDETAALCLPTTPPQHKKPSVVARPRSFNNRMDHQQSSSPKKVDISPVAPRRKASIKLGSS